MGLSHSPKLSLRVPKTTAVLSSWQNLCLLFPPISLTSLYSAVVSTKNCGTLKTETVGTTETVKHHMDGCTDASFFFSLLNSVKTKQNTAELSFLACCSKVVPQ